MVFVKVWVAGVDKSISIYMAHDPDKGKDLGHILLNSEPKVTVLRSFFL